VDAPARTHGFDAEDLAGESQFSAEEAGGRRPRGNGGRPSATPLDPAPATLETLGRWYLEEATESPGRVAPGETDWEDEPESSSSELPEDEDWEPERT
jgi:hypothetical protein